MHLRHRIIVNVLAGVFLLLWPCILAKPTKYTELQCPIGFNLTYTYDKEYYICYRLKGPESFADRFEGCAGNLYTSKLYHSLNITRPDIVLWTNYKSLYPGGPFIDWSYTASMGDVLITTYDVKYDPKFGIDEELCVVEDPSTNFTATRCLEKYHRYCMVKPYFPVEDMTNEGCEELKGFRRFWSPRATCLAPVTGMGGGTIRATWRQAQELCGKRGGSLLHRGWRYANNPLFHSSTTNWTDPLGIAMTPGDSLLWLDEEDGNVAVPDAEWNFHEEPFSPDTSLVALQNGSWRLVNSSYIFFDVICERSIHLRNVSMNLTIDFEGKLVLAVNDSVEESQIYCYTDSVIYYPTSIKITRHSQTDFILKPMSDGYYWCVHVDSTNYHVTESNKALFVREKQTVVNYYAVKIRIKGKYRFENLEKLYRVWEKKLKQYIFYRTKYVKTVGDLTFDDPYETERVLKEFGHSSLGSNWKDKEVISLMKLKRLYLDGRTVLLHVYLNPEMLPLTPGVWEDIEVIFMKPAYYCKSFDSVPMLALGQSITTYACRTYSCLGDFNEGVQWVATVTEGCTTSTRAPVGVDSAINVDVVPPTTEVKPDEQLLQILDDLEKMLNNDSVPILVDDITDSLDQVDTILEVDDELEIPGQLLHLLDQLGAQVYLNGSHTASAIGNNIALLMADAAPDAPIRGLRIAATDDEVFSTDAFEFITDEVNATQLESEVSEAVVHLPPSVTSVQRRISFIVFRNDRAFHTNHSHFTVNSRVLSINVEDMTQFEDGEVIDIHLRPDFEDVDRNMSRACAYWQFLEDGSGYWSQEGCTLVRARQAGVLDTCRCDHLTHFAEVLFPRSVFSQRNEDILEIMSIVGCCLSIFGIAMIALTAALFRSWRRDFSNKIWLQLCIAIFLLSVLFLVIVFAKFDQYDVSCMLIGVALHYSVLASFCWMLVAAVLSYRRLVLVFTRDASHKLLRASAFSWGAPCAVVGILLSVSPHSYAGRFEEKTPSGAFCYPSGLGLWLAVYAPIAVMLLANWTLFGLIVRSVFASRRIQRHGDSNEALRCASVSCLLVFLFGLPWIFGLFAFNVVAAYFFTLTATFQGFVLFVFFVLGNKKTRDLWLNKLKIKQTRTVPVTSSTYTNNKSSGASLRGASAGAASMEANSSKPRSLASPDDSRFS